MMLLISTCYGVLHRSYRTKSLLALYGKLPSSCHSEILGNFGKPLGLKQIRAQLFLKIS